ncbi:XdhC family protein [Alkalihalobacillus sp. MEB130]|uniref:XdhC family protein n=1 Tax=Alkalihalobacillus sp. MEB130 TaxID=2976704 RepID=UPI0028DECBC9|nr:XdhC family protein [Alkalihalobacillus sp. MEB130]MDT8860882.1 XdhC family protein [Alkalihalobacillus sp. MEB130]
MKELYKYLTIMKQHSNQTCAMATVIEVEGSAYRHEGAKMLFLEDGRSFGLISGGCLEEDLQIRATDVMRLNRPETIVYDLQAEDDLGWGQGAGCNGKINVLLEPISWGEMDEYGNLIWPGVHEAFKMGENVITVREVVGHQIKNRFFFTTNGEIIGSSQPNHCSDLLRKDVVQFFQQNRIFDYQFHLELNTQYLFELHEAKDVIYIFGAGTDVEPVVKRLAEFDFLPVLIDPKESRCQPSVFPDATQYYPEHPETFLANHKLRDQSYVLIMTHSFERDQLILSYFLKHQPKYLGILGPKRRTERLLGSTFVPEWVHSPIGMEIDAEGAEEISLSILAELIKVRNEKRMLNKRRKKAQQIR